MEHQDTWKCIPGWEQLYWCSYHGKIKSKKQILKPSIQKCGHLRVSLSKNGKITYHLVHKLILLSFIGKKPKGKECCHKDGNPANNKLSNLYYGTRSENISDAKKHGTFPMGNNRPGAKLTNEQAIKIYSLCSLEFKDRYIAELFNVSVGCIVQIRLGNNWKEITRGIPIRRRGKSSL